MKVADAMSVDVVTVTPETPLKDAAALLAQHRISGLPVLEAEAVVGVVSEADIVTRSTGRRESRSLLGAWVAGDRDEGNMAAARVGETMSAPAITISPERQVAEAARVMVERGVNRLPVVEDSRLVGILTRADLVRASCDRTRNLSARSAPTWQRPHCGSTVELSTLPSTVGP